MTARASEEALIWTGTTESDMGELAFGHLSVSFGRRSAWKQGTFEVSGQLYFADRSWMIRTRNNGMVVCEHIRLPVFHADPRDVSDLPDDQYGLGTFHRNISSSKDDNVVSMTDLDLADMERQGYVAQTPREDQFGTGRSLFGLGTSGDSGRLRVLVLFDRAACTPAEFNLASSIESTMRLAWERNMGHGNFDVIFTCAGLGLARRKLRDHYRAVQMSSQALQIRARYGGDVFVVINENRDNGEAAGTGGQAWTPRRGAVTVVKRHLLNQMPNLVVHEVGHNFGMNHDRYNVQFSDHYGCNMQSTSCTWAFHSNYWRSIMSYHTSVGCAGPGNSQLVMTYSGADPRVSSKSGEACTNNFATFKRHFNIVAGLYSSGNCPSVSCSPNNPQGCSCSGN